MLLSFIFFNVVGNLIWNLRPNNMEEADSAFGKYGLELILRKPWDDDYKNNHLFLLEKTDYTAESLF